MPGSSVHVPGDVFAGVDTAEMIFALDTLRETEQALRELRVLQGSRGLAADERTWEIEALRKVAESLEAVLEYMG